MPHAPIVCVEDLLRQEEGLRLTPYRCPAGNLTIGYGHNLDARPISIDDAGHILETDIVAVTVETAHVVGELTFCSLDPVRQAVMVSMAFQMGVAGLASFRATLECVRRGDYEQAARNMVRSRWAQQTPDRARRHAEMMRTGRWPAIGDYA